jgi:hypothetical protein
MGAFDPLFERYGEWPDEPLAVPDPASPVQAYNSVTSVTLRTDKGVYADILVLDATDVLELERQREGL